MVKSWNRVFLKVFKTAKPAIKGGHPHRFRDTFAVSLLLKGVSIEIVSKLLGHRDHMFDEQSGWVAAQLTRSVWMSHTTARCSDRTDNPRDEHRDRRPKSFASQSLLTSSRSARSARMLWDVLSMRTRRDSVLRTVLRDHRQHGPGVVADTA